MSGSATPWAVRLRAKARMAEDRLRDHHRLHPLERLEGGPAGRSLVLSAQSRRPRTRADHGGERRPRRPHCGGHGRGLQRNFGVAGPMGRRSGVSGRIRRLRRRFACVSPLPHQDRVDAPVPEVARVEAFTGPFGFLSNSARVPIEIEGLRYPTVEFTCRQPAACHRRRLPPQRKLVGRQVLGNR